MRLKLWHRLRRRHDYAETPVGIGLVMVFACPCGAVWRSSERFERRYRHGQPYNHPIWP